MQRADTSTARMRRKTLITWMQHAHAMEAQSLAILLSRAADCQETVSVRLRLEAHLGETQRHIERLQQALERLGSTPKPFQAGPHRLALTTNITAPFFLDPLLGTVLSDLAAEQFEVSAYTALIAVAEHAGEAEIARLCRLNRSEDEEMAEWLDAQIPIVVAERIWRVGVMSR